jgi:hypothetical protein
MITNLGSITVGEVLPGAVSISVAGQLGINSALPDIVARLAALQAWSPQPVSFAASLALAQATLAGILLAIELDLPVPDISAQIAIIAALIAALESIVNLVNQQLEFIVAFGAIFAESGVAAYRYDGAPQDLGSEFSTELAGMATPGNALVLVASTPAAWSAMSALMKVNP